MPSSPSRWTLRTKLLASVLALFTRRHARDERPHRPRDAALPRGRSWSRTSARPSRGSPTQGAVRRPRRETATATPGLRAAARSARPGAATSSCSAWARTARSGRTPAGQQVNAVVNEDGRDDTLDAAQVRERSATHRRSCGPDAGRRRRRHRPLPRLTARDLPDGARVIVGVSTEPVDELLEELARRRHRACTSSASSSSASAARCSSGAASPRSTGSPPPPAGSRPSSSTRGRWPSPSGCRAEDADGHTEVGQVGLALNTMLDNVESALHARQESETQVRQFVADASHELRTPLASIRGYAELTRRETEPVPPTVTPRHRPGRVRGAADAGARRGPAPARPPRLRPAARARAGRPVAARRQRRERRPRRRRPTTPGSSTCPRTPSRCPATRPACTRSSPTCSPTRAPTRRPGRGSSPGCGPRGQLVRVSVTRRRARRPRAVAADRLRAVHPRRRLPHPRQRVDRARPEHRRRRRPGPRRPRRGVEPPGRDDLLGPPPRHLTPGIQTDCGSPTAGRAPQAGHVADPQSVERGRP